jgi:4'-phosphopantetheinyl transferase
MTALAVIGSTAEVLEQFADPLRLLTPDERFRAAAFRFDGDRDDFIAAHLLIRMAVAEVTGLAPEQLTLVQRCRRCRGPHGPPRMAETPEWSVSLSHTRSHVVASASSAAAGVDVERLDRRYPQGVEEVALTPAEAEFVRAAPDAGRALLELWVRKEAVIKALGADLGLLPDIELVRSGRIVDVWEGLHLTIWADDGRVIAACAAPTAPVWRHLSMLGAIKAESEVLHGFPYRQGRQT